MSGADSRGPIASAAAWPALAGEMAARVRAHPWAATPLGPIERWSHSLRVTVSAVLSSGHPMFMAWGPELVSIFNDAYAPILGAKLEHALGRPFPELWADAWQQIEPMVAVALSGRGT